MSSDSSNLYGYVPSGIVAIVFGAIFLVLTVLHLWRIVRTRHWFGIATLVGGIFEVIGLAARAYSHHDALAKGPYIIQVLLILLAPIIFSAAIYMFLGRLIRATGHAELSFIRINILTKIFVLGDVICFFIQASGAGKLVSADTSSAINSAETTVLVGLGLQVVFFCIFALCAIVFHVRISRPENKMNVDPALRLDWMLYSLYFSSAMIVIRNIYRLVEYKTGTSGYLQVHEWPAYAFDVALMACMMMASLFWYSAKTKAARISGSYPLVLQDV
ncbi:RTA1 like protein [Aspergillus costaricaensis CBS 115574]|uniref:RTA1 like protein n=1 Tax=Aspergillus costaricaensis CBS 115574 TaxID=1448317 RepID=A0ACD1I4H2_9EURO|nr:RTA1 like protein [Aspergillus costaricaensis CBS 115574]RAK85204.1 RTA1 like protein [Aspergillus costaricaensis CBS 115574]